MNEKLNIIKGGQLVIQNLTANKELGASKAAFRITNENDKRILVHLDGRMMFSTNIENVTIQDGRTGTPVQLTPTNWSDLTDGLSDSEGGGVAADLTGEVLSFADYYAKKEANELEDIFYYTYRD